MALQDIVQLSQSFLDPFPWGRLENLVATATQALEFLFQGVDSSFRFQERLGESATAASLADEIDEIGEAAFLSIEFGLLEP